MPNLSNTVTFLFAGDGSLASDGLSAFLQTKSNFLLLSECVDGITTIADIRSRHPEIAVIDAQLPDMNARQIVQGVRVDNRDTRIIVLGASADRNIADELLAAGRRRLCRAQRSLPPPERCDTLRAGWRQVSCPATYPRPAGVRRPLFQPEFTERLSPVFRPRSKPRRSRCSGSNTPWIARSMPSNYLQQKVEQLTGAPLEPPPPTSQENSARRLKRPGIRTGISAVAAALVLLILGFQLAGILLPAPASQVKADPSFHQNTVSSVAVPTPRASHR